MSRARALARKSNPLRSDTAWWTVLLQGIIAVAIGIYILTAEQNARENFNVGVGLFLLLSGLSAARDGRRARAIAPRSAGYLWLRAGIGLATGLIIVVNQFAGSMTLNQVGAVAGIGLLGLGLTTFARRLVGRHEAGAWAGSIAGGIVLAAWGIVTLIQAANDSSSARFIGCSAIVAGVLYCLIALYRRRGRAAPAFA